MIRELAPIILIPAAWLMTFATVIYPGLDLYWIEHMHYFITIFLVIFVVSSWKLMESKVLSIWRKVIGLGIIATGLGALSFNTGFYPEILASFSLFYWLAAPGIAAYYSSKEMTQHSKTFRFIGYAGVTALLLYLQGYIIQNNMFKILGLIIAGISQSLSIFLAARIDDNL